MKTNSKWASKMGFILAAFTILSYYAVIGGWIIKYFVSYMFTAQAPADFGAFIAKPAEPLAWFFLFMLLTGIICYFGVDGIERASKFMMPALFVILLIIIGRGLTLPGASKGLAFIVNLLSRLKSRASCLSADCLSVSRSYASSTGVDYTVRTVPALQFIPVSMLRSDMSHIPCS